MSPRLVLLGDSITELSFAAGGWGAALADHFARKRWALRVVATAMEDAAADADPAAVVTVFFGANDACLPDHRHSMRSHMHVPLDEYQANLRAICGYLKVASESYSVSRTCMEKLTLQNYRKEPMKLLGLMHMHVWQLLKN
uniref:SGNH hydrolase-type esterase domain-containing protein n=1 Tax=Oryza meridionalis TaxID=40149 RepID=A0A0E0C3C0_9ORYZ